MDSSVVNTPINKAPAASNANAMYWIVGHGFVSAKLLLKLDCSLDSLRHHHKLCVDIK